MGTFTTDNQKSTQKSGTTSPKRETLKGAVILILAQVSCASTATCVHALPEETPSVLRGLWRQTLTSLIFTPLAVGVYLTQRNMIPERLPPSHQDPDEESALLAFEQKYGDGKPEELKTTCSVESRDKNENASTWDTIIYVLTGVCGATLLNDAMVIALKYASSAAVLCLVNTTPIWIYAISTCNPPRAMLVGGAALSLVGAVICAVGGRGGGDDDVVGSSGVGGAEEFGSVIALTGGIGGAMYMTACGKLSPLGLHPIYLTLMINTGMMLSSLILCLATVEGGLAFASTDTGNGFFGFVNPRSNPAAFFQSIFPDCFGNFGIIISLSFFDPLIVSMVMLTEPLNASLIAMAVVQEEPPTPKTIIAVTVVLVGCALVLGGSSKDGQDATAREKELGEEFEAAHPTKPLTSEESSQLDAYVRRRRASQVVLLSTIGTYAPDVTIKAAWRDPRGYRRPARIMSLAPGHYRDMGLSDEERVARSEGVLAATDSHSTRSSMPSVALFRSLRPSTISAISGSSRLLYRFGSMEQDEDQDESTA